MSSILSHIEENPQDTQRLIGLGYPELQQLIQNAERFITISKYLKVLFYRID